MNYILKTFLIGIFFCIGFIILGYNSRISYNCNIKEGVKGFKLILYLVIANVLGPLYTIYYYLYKFPIANKGKSCLS